MSRAHAVAPARRAPLPLKVEATGHGARTVARCLGGCGTPCGERLLCRPCWRAIGSGLRKRILTRTPRSTEAWQSILLDVEAACIEQRRRNR